MKRKERAEGEPGSDQDAATAWLSKAFAKCSISARSSCASAVWRIMTRSPVRLSRDIKAVPEGLSRSASGLDRRHGRAAGDGQEGAQEDERSPREGPGRRNLAD